MASPSPVPPYLRVVALSACVNGVNSRLSTSGLMPMPVSCTSPHSQPLLWLPASHSPRRRRVTLPACVNLMALPTRFVMTWRTRAGSPDTSAGTVSSMWTMNSRPPASARREITSTVSPTRSRGFQGMLSISSIPASIFEKSRMSLIRPSSVSPLVRHTFR